MESRTYALKLEERPPTTEPHSHMLKYRTYMIFNIIWYLLGQKLEAQGHGLVGLCPGPGPGLLKHLQHVQIASGFRKITNIIGHLDTFYMWLYVLKRSQCISDKCLSPAHIERYQTKILSHTCKNKSLPWSVKTLHFDVCILEITDPSSIFRKPVRLASCRSFSELGSIETSSAKAGLEFTHRITVAEKEEN